MLIYVYMHKRISICVNVQFCLSANCFKMSLKKSKSASTPLKLMIIKFIKNNFYLNWQYQVLAKLLTQVNYAPKEKS